MLATRAVGPQSEIKLKNIKLRNNIKLSNALDEFHFGAIKSEEQSILLAL